MRTESSQSKLLSSLPADELDRLEPYLHVVDMKFGERLLTAGEPIACVWFPHNCVTSTVVEQPDGETIEVGLMGLEGLVGLSLLLGSTVSNTTVIVQVPGTATSMHTDDFLRYVVAPRGTLYDALLRYTNAFMAMVAQTAACNSLHEVNQRLARWVLMTQDRVSAAEIPLTQEFLAYMLGVRRASVSIAASALADRGLISYNRGIMRVLDRKGLEASSCVCYSIVVDMTRRLYNGSP